MTRVTEATPLLAASAQGPTTQAGAETLDIHKIGAATTIAEEEQRQQEDEEDEEDEQPLPVRQIVILCYARMIEPVAFFSIFPFVNQMIKDVGGIREEDVGFYSGLIESLFSLTQMVMMIFWGRASDRFGRRPVLIYSLIGVSIATCLFGYSQALWQMILFRCLAGVFSGSIVTVRTLLSENTTSKTQARAFSWFAFTGNLGIFIGPIIGGGLSNPATQYPRVFGGIRFLHDYPYALPSMVSGALGLSAVVVVSLFLKETLETNPSGKKSTAPMTIIQLVKQPGVMMVLFVWCLVATIGLSNTAVAAVFWFTSVPLGGLGFSPLMISVFIGASGISQALWLLFVFPPAHRRFGTRGLMIFCGYVFPIACLSSPINNWLRRRGLEAAFWTLMPCSIIFGSSAGMSFTSMQLAVNNVSPSPEVLGTINALALSITAGIRAFTPGLFASLFATGVRTQILDGYLVWVVMIALMLILLVAIHYLPKEVEGKETRSCENEE